MAFITLLILGVGVLNLLLLQEIGGYSFVIFVNSLLGVEQSLVQGFGHPEHGLHRPVQARLEEWECFPETEFFFKYQGHQVRVNETGVQAIISQLLH